MKSLKLIVGVLLAVGIVACQEEELSENVNAIEQQIAQADVETEESAAATYEEVDDIVEEGILNLTNNGRLEVNRTESLRCAEVNHDEINQVIEISFDGSCEGPNGHVKSGKIIITYNDTRYVPGAFRSVTFENFLYDSIQVEGTRTITNVSETSESAPMFNIVLENGMLTFPDGTFISRSSNHTRTWIRTDNPLNDSMSLIGSSDGTRRDGTTYHIEITTELIYNRACRRISSIPVSGVKEISWDDNLLAMDFGDGECDRLVEFNLNGETDEREVKPRGFRNR